MKCLLRLCSHACMVLGLFQPSLHAQAGDTTLTLSSRVFGEERQVELWFPPGHDAASPQATPLPTLYVLQGARYGSLSAAVVNELQRQGRIPPLLVVGIHHETESEELSPAYPYRSGYEPPAVLGDRLMDFLAMELIPQLESRFAVAPFRILAGHDAGGLFALGTLMQRPTLFQAYLAAAPPIYRLADPERAYRTYLVGYPGFSGFVYITMGFGDQEMMSETLKYTRLFKAHSVERPMTYHFELLEEETNASLYAATLYRGLYFAPDKKSF